MCQDFKKIPSSVEVFYVIVSLNSLFSAVPTVPTDNSLGEVFCLSLLSKQSLLIYYLHLRAIPYKSCAYSLTVTSACFLEWREFLHSG